MPHIETKSVAFELKSFSGDGATFEGHGAVYANMDRGRDIIAPGAYARHMDEFRREGKIRDEHSVTTGRILAADDSGTGLFVKGQISDTTAGRDQRTLLRDGVLTRLSIGHYVLGKEYLESPEEVKSYWNSIGYRPTDQDLVRSANGARLITEARPMEVSTTFIPMNEKCAITSVKSDSGRPAGLTFDDHSDNVLATVEEYQERAWRLFEKRKADRGRSLSTKHLASFRRLSQRLAGLLEAMGHLEAKGEPEDGTSAAPSDARGDGQGKGKDEAAAATAGTTTTVVMPGAEAVANVARPETEQGPAKDPAGPGAGPQADADPEADTKSDTTATSPGPVAASQLYAEFLAACASMHGVET